jgi:tetratricopeptide (TPR) repeat protein
MNNKIIPLKVDASFFFERAVRCLDKMNFKGAIKYFRRAVEHDPVSPLNHCNLAGVLSETGEFKESNKILFHVITHIDPKAYYCYYYIANNYANMGEFDRAATYANKYLKADIDGEFAEDAEEMIEFFGSEDASDASIDIAGRLLEEGKFKEASQELLKSLKENPKDHIVRNNLALAYFYAGNVDQAIAETEKILAVEPHNIHARCNLAVFYFQQEQPVKVAKEIAYLQKVIPFEDDYVYKLALTLGMLGDHELAYSHLKRLLRHDAMDDYQIIYMAGVAAANSGRLREALQLWQRAIRIIPDSEVAQFYIEIAEQAIVENRQLDIIGYFYNLPFEEHLRKIEMRLEKGVTTTEIFQDPVAKLSLFWALKHSDDKTKFNVIRLLSIVFDDEVRSEFERFLINPEENDDLKKIILILFHQIGIEGPYSVYMKKQMQEITSAQVAKMYIAWKPEWVQVLELVIDNIAEQESDSTVYIADLEAIWINFLSKNGDSLPKTFKPEAFAAALEYAVYRLHNLKITQKEVADKYHISTATLASKYKQLK